MEYIKIIQLREEVRYQTVAVVTKYKTEYIKVPYIGYHWKFIYKVFRNGRWEVEAIEYLI
jgi:hypothetical protein